MSGTPRAGRKHLFGTVGRKWPYALAVAILGVGIVISTAAPAWIGVGVLLLTGLLGFYCVAMANRDINTEMLNHLLVESNRRLQKEIAERKQAEATLWTSELKYKTLFDTSSEAILLIAPDGEFLDGNRAAAEFFGRKDISEFLALKPADVSPEYQPNGQRSVDMAREMLEIALREGTIHFEWAHKRLNGKEGLATITLTRMEADGKPILLATIRDITEQRQKEEALRESENRYRQLFDQSADAVLVADVASKMLVDCNKRAESLMGYSREELLSMQVDRLHPKDVRADTMKSFVAQADGTLKTPYETIILNKAGEAIPVLISAGPVEIGEKQYLIGVFTNVSEQKRAQQRQAKLMQRLEGVNRLQENLLLPGTFAEKLQRVTDAAIALLDLDFCRIWHVGPGDLCSNGCIHAVADEAKHVCPRRDQCLHLVASSGRYTHINGDHRRVPWGCYKIGRIASGEDNKFLTNDVTSDPHVHNHAWARSLGLVSFAGYKLRNADGEPVGVLAMFAKHAIGEEDDAFLCNLTEITSKVIIDGKAEEALRAADRKLRLFVENVSDVIWTTDFTGAFTYVTPSVEAEFDYTPEEFLQLSLNEVLTPDSEALAMEKLRNVVAHAQRGEYFPPDIVEMELMRKDGTPVWGEVTYGGMYDESGKMTAIQGIYRQIGDRKRMEKERQLTTQRMESLLALNRMADRPMGEIIATAVEDAIRLTESEIGYLAVTDEDESILTMQYWSKSAHASCNVVDKPIVYPVEKTGLWGEAVRQRRPVVTNDYAAPNPHKRGVPEGHVPIVRHMNIPVFDGKRIVAVAGVGNKRSDYEPRDCAQLQLLMDGWWQIARRKQYEQELARARDAAEAANQAKSRFLAAMSHEIRTPLTAILGYTDLLMDPTISASSRNNYSATIRRSGEHLLMLINDILDLSKIEAGKLTLEFAHCNVVSLLADVASVVRPRAESRGVSFSVEYPETVPETILTDGSRLRQALINLAGNAVKFTENGSVRIVVSLSEPSSGDQPTIQFDVIDTGIGIREDVLAQLFKPFSQGDTSVTKKFGGTGLGLAISHHIVHLLGGDLTARSVWGKGSTFRLTAPTGSLENVRMLRCPAEAEQESRGQVWQTPTNTLLGTRILLAEDGFDNRELIQAVLKRAGATIETAENGRLAVAMATSETFDLILMDMNMPEMDGYEATSVLRDAGYHGPILALTANAMSEDRQRCELAGCNEYLTKPIDREHLVQTIAKYTSAKEGRQPMQDDHLQRETRMEHTKPTTDQAIISEYIDDPDMAGIIRDFVGRLASHKRDMRQALDAGDLEELRRSAHKLKGAGGSYGYPSLTEACRTLEDAAKAHNLQASTTAFDAVVEIIQAVENGCNANVSTGADL